MPMDPDEAKARRKIAREARAVRRATVEAIDRLDDLLDDAGEALSVQPRAAFREALEHLTRAAASLDCESAKHFTRPASLREVTG